MPVVSGSDERREVRGSLGTTTDLGAGIRSFCRGIVPGSFLTGIWAETVPTVFPWVIPGILQPMFGGELFEKILVRPRQIPLGFVLAGSVTPIEVWNTHQSEAKTLTSAPVTGVGGVVITGPQSMVYGPGQAQAYVESVGLVGTPTIDSTITWTFAGELGTDTLVTGTRLVVFCVPCDWSQPYEETESFKTSILEGVNTAEQRIALRRSPRYTLSFRAMGLDEGSTMEMEALLYGWQANTFGVPMWPEYSPLLAEAAAGAQALSVNTTDRPAFTLGGFAMVWAGMQAWEAFGILALTGSSITLDAPLKSTWPAGTRVVPLRLGHLSDNQPLGRPTNWLRDGVFTFSCGGL